MKMIVPIKRVIDAYVNIRVKKDGSGVDTHNVKMSINPFDEIALEEAIRLKEKNIAQEIIALSIGAQACQESLRTALALGADRAIHIVTDKALEPLNIAKIIKVMVEKEQPNLLLLGKQAIDDDNNQTGQMLAALLDWPQATFASKIECDQQQLIVTREIDGGLETLKLSLPAVITADLRLNTPRYASLPNIMKAKRKTIETIPLDELAVQLVEHYEVIHVAPPVKRQAGEVLASAQDLVAKLRNVEHVI